ncbi:DUF6183 family protein [Streptomyces griseosporeus]|uniref:DUF6183 family protein n=1 Tax=Streptomyces griseosporeus TaxID=1910 RepID=UPI0019C603C3|nr:DUF6183 family protein [Streptomyces griseosporeus]GHF77885.1 hypothetical protein GCM10018783_55110 [Streptomyces griseosporeus]
MNWENALGFELSARTLHTVADRIQEIVTQLPGLTSVSDVCKLADRSLARGDAAFVADLGTALTGSFGADSGRIWQYRSVIEHLLRLLATTPGSGNVAQALRLVSSAEIADRKLDRCTASLLASSHPAEELALAFDGQRASEELRSCLVHELVLRGVGVMEIPGIAQWVTSPNWKHHSLGWLPLALSDVEGQPDLPSYSADGYSYSMPYGPWEDGGEAVVAGVHAPAVEETTTETVAKGIGSAVANWAEESNGRIEARVFELAEPLEAERVPSLLPALGLECLKGAAEESGLSVAACPPDEAWRLLFAAASTGGAYNSGIHGAYGRLAAWQSLASLSGAAEGDPAEAVEARARACAWYCFSAHTPWFEQVAWDIGLVALSPDWRRLAVLAATDTD